MTKVKVFELIESAGSPDKYIIGFHPERFCCERTTGSFALMAARVMNLSYANYCRFCRDNFGAEIIGKKSKYPVIYFTKSPETTKLINTLNARATLILKLRKDWEESNVSKT